MQAVKRDNIIQAAQFNDFGSLYEILSVVTFEGSESRRSPNTKPFPKVTVVQDENALTATIDADSGTITIKRYEWIVRESAGLAVLTEEGFEQFYRVL